MRSTRASISLTPFKRLPFSTPLPVLDRELTELRRSRLLRMQLQVELPQSLGEFRPKLVGIRFALESNHDVVRESHDDDITARSFATPRLAASLFSPAQKRCQM